MIRNDDRRRRTTPWGSITALLAACFATLAGLLRGIDPEVILWRSIVVATVAGSLVAVLGSVSQSIQHRTSEKKTH